MRVSLIISWNLSSMSWFRPFQSLMTWSEEKEENFSRVCMTELYLKMSLNLSWKRISLYSMIKLQGIINTPSRGLWISTKLNWSSKRIQRDWNSIKKSAYKSRLRVLSLKRMKLKLKRKWSQRRLAIRLHWRSRNLILRRENTSYQRKGKEG